MNWHPVRPTTRAGESLPPSRHAIRSDCGRFQISKMLVAGLPGYLLWDITARPARLIDAPVFDTADAAKEHAEDLA